MPQIYSSGLAGSSLVRRRLLEHQHQLQVDGNLVARETQSWTVRHATSNQHGHPFAASQPSRREFNTQHYRQEDILQLDLAFYIIHLVMTAIHKRLLVTPNGHLQMQCVMAVVAAVLLLRVFFKPLYIRVRPPVVFSIQCLLTLMRAAVVYSMSSQQAVHYRVSMWADTNHSAAVLVTTMLAITGGPFRLFEMLGLQQPWSYHVLITVLYLLVHPWAASTGIRLAFSNTMFYQVHTVHDGVRALMGLLLRAITGIPTDQQTCSSCAGVVIYTFMCLFGSVAVPLYFMYVWEQAAFHRYTKQVNAGAAAAATASGVAAVGAAAGSSQLRSAHVETVTAAANVASISSRQLPASSYAISSPRTQQGEGRTSQHSAQQQRPQAGSIRTAVSSTRGYSNSSIRDGHHELSGSLLELLCQQAEAVADEQHNNITAIPRLSDLVVGQSALVRWCVHLSALVCLMMGCWLLSNAIALVLLPRVLNSFQLSRWCPNQPLVPFVIAGLVYTGL